MLFRPKFCANCGVAVERSEWYPWTSRRFCVVCEIEFKGNEIIPKAGFAVGVLLGVIGLASLFGSGTKSGNTRVLDGDVRVAKEDVVQRARLVANIPAAEADRPPVHTATPPPASNSRGPSAVIPPVVAKAPERVDDRPTYCGAETRKGTPCSRRVKSGGRCFQHAGMPAMDVTSSAGGRTAR